MNLIEPDLAAPPMVQISSFAMVVKNLFRHRKCRYKGLAKNAAQLHVLFAMANLVLSQRSLCAPYRTGASCRARNRGDEPRKGLGSMIRG